MVGEGKQGKIIFQITKFEGEFNFAQDLIYFRILTTIEVFLCLFALHYNHENTYPPKTQTFK